jgi:nitrilase
MKCTLLILACYNDLASSPDEMCPGGSAIVGPLGDYIKEPEYIPY